DGAGGFNQFAIDGGAGLDTLVLDGTISGLISDINTVGNVESLVKTGTGTWTIQQNPGTQAAGSASFTNGVTIQEGTLDFREFDNGLVQHVIVVESDITNYGIVAGDLALGNAGYTFSNLVNGGNSGVVTANIAFGTGDDTLINNGAIRPNAGINLSDGLSAGEGIHLGDGDDTFINSGYVQGGVTLNGGADRFVMNSDTLFDTGTGLILGGADIDTIVLGGSGGTLIQINNASSAIREFESLEVDSTGTWDFSSNLTLSNDITVTKGILLVNTAVAAANATVTGGILQVNGELDIDRTLTVNGGLLTIDQGGLLLVPDLLVGPNGVVGGNGTIGSSSNEVDLILNGTLSPATVGTIGNLEINGDLTVGATGVLHIDVDPAAGTADNLVVNGDVDLLTGSTLYVDPGTQTIAAGSSFKAIDYTGTLNGTFTTTNPALLTYDVVYDTANTQVLVTVNLNANAAGGGGLTGTENQKSAQNLIAAVLVAEGGLPGGNFNAIAVLPAGAAFDQTHSELYGAPVFAIQQQGNSFMQAMKARVDDREHCSTLRGFGQESCRPTNSIAPDNDAWINVAYLTNELDTSLALNSEIDGFGIYGGIDSRQSGTTFGLAGGVSMSTLTDSLGEADTVGLHLGGYFSQPLVYFNLDGAASYNFGAFDATRKVSVTGFSGNGTVENDVGHLSGNLRITQEYQNGHGLEFQPEFGITYDRLAMDGFNEGGTLGNAALTVGDFEWSDVSLYAGMHVRKAIKSGGSIVIPEFRVGYKESLTDENYELSTKFTAFTPAAVTIYSETPKSTWTVGGGVNYEDELGMVVFGDVDYNFSEVHNELVAQGGLRLRF
ncbi:autotransporter domain-containing protein, partial [Alphaproteobacteria bacterium]|nr:autotransporter domain-containing protein [Alphaproteobacteria bacterium]